MKTNFAQRKLHVMSVTNELYIGGDENRLFQFATTIDRSRFEHTVICLKADDPNLDARWGTLRPRFAEAGIVVEELERKRASTDFKPGVRRFMGSASIVWRTVWNLRRVIRERDVDIVSAHVDPAGLVSVLAASAAGRPSVVTTYYPEPMGATWEPKWLWWSRRQLELSLANLVITDSAVKRDELRRWMLRKNVVIPVIPNGAIRPVARKAGTEVRRLLDIAPHVHGPVIGQVSRIIKHKGQMQLLRAIPLVLRRHPNAYFLIIGFPSGDPAYADSLHQESVSLGIAQNVKICPYPGPIGDVWQLIDIHAHAPLDDSLPNAIMEGMSLAKPAVVTSVGGIPTMVENGRTGIVVPPDNTQALADALVKLLDQRELAENLGKAALNRYEERYTPEIMTRQLEKTLVETCHKRQ